MDKSFKNALEEILDKKFADQDKKFDTRFNKQDKRFEQQDDKLEELVLKVDKLDETLDERMTRLFNQGFEEVAVPFIEGVEEGLKAGQNRIERKLDKFATDSIEHGITLKQHGVRISKLEQKIAA